MSSDQAHLSDRPAFAALLALLHERKEACKGTPGGSFRGLETLTGFNRSQIEAAFRDRKLALSVKLARALDEALDAGGRIVAARDAAYREQRDARDRAYGPVASASGEVAEEDETNRREVLETLAAGASLLAERIGASRRGPTSGDLYAAYRIVADLSARYPTTPHDELLGDVAREWRRAEDLLADGWRSDRYREGYQLVAGQLTYLLSRLAFNMGDYRKTAAFLGLVEEHANACDDPSLRSACATMWSSIFFYEGNYPAALRAAREGLRHRHAYDVARLHSYAARALAALGDDEALYELDRMDAAVRSDAAPEASAEPFLVEDAQGMRAISLARLGRVDEALPLVDASLAGYARLARPSFESVANTHLVRGWALMRADPAEAAASVNRGLAVIDGRPTHTVLHRAVEIASTLRAHRATGPVAELFDRLAVTRLVPRELTA